MTLPRLFVNCSSYRHTKDENGNFKWEGKVIEVEVVTLHLRTGMMRVRSVEKHPKYGDGAPETLSFDKSIDEFFEQYDLVKKI